MSYRRRRRRRRNRNQTTSNTTTRTVAIDVPIKISRYIPAKIVAPSVRKYPARRTHRLVLPKVRKQQTVRRRVKIVTRHSNQPTRSKIRLTDNRMTIFGARNVAKTLTKESNRRRRNERKIKKRRGRPTGHLGSLRRDNYGIVGANRNRSLDTLEAAAAIGRYLGG